MGDIDYTGAMSLQMVIEHLRAVGISIAIARAGSQVVTDLEQSGILTTVGREHLFDTVDEAVNAVLSPDTPDRTREAKTRKTQSQNE